MANDRLGQFEREVRAKSEARDAELAEYRERLAAAIGKQAELGDRLSELAAVVNALRDVKPTSILALWGPAIALGAAVASAGSFVLTVTVTPIKEKVDAAAADNRELSSLYGGISRELAKGAVIQERNTTWLRGLEERVGRLSIQTSKLEERTK
jgi:hypothetical protein